MTSLGTSAFLQFAGHLRQVRAREAEINQKAAVRRQEFRASLVEKPEKYQSDLTVAIALHRGRTVSG